MSGTPPTLQSILQSMLAIPTPPLTPLSPLPANVNNPGALPPTVCKAVIHQVSPTNNNPTTCSVLINNRMPARSGFTFPAGVGQFYEGGSTALFTTSAPHSISAGSQVVTPSNMGGATTGLITIGTSIVVDTAASGVQETVTVTAVSSATFTATFAHAHSPINNQVIPLVATVAAPGPFFNNPTTLEGGSYAYIDTVNMCVVQILQGVSSTYPNSAATLVANHVHTGAVDNNGNPLPQPIDLQAETQNTIGTGQLPSTAPPAPAIERIYAPGDTNAHKTAITPTEVSQGIISDLAVSTWASNVPSDQSINKLGWALRKSGTGGGSWWISPPPIGGGPLTATPDAVTSDAIIEYGTTGSPLVLSPVGNALFYARFVGTFTDPITGVGTLGCFANDGCNIIVDGVPIVSNLGNGDSGSYEYGAFTFSTGTVHSIVIEWANTNTGGIGYQLQLGYTPTSSVTSPIYGTLAIDYGAVNPWAIWEETFIPGLPSPAPEQNLLGDYGQVLAGVAYDLGCCYIATGEVKGPISVFAYSYNFGPLDGIAGPGGNQWVDSDLSAATNFTLDAGVYKSANDPNAFFDFIDGIACYIMKGGPNGSNNFVVGGSDANTCTWLSQPVTVQAGQVVTVSAYIDATQATTNGNTGGAFIALCDFSGGAFTTLYQKATQPKGSVGRVSCTYTIPAGMTQIAGVYSSDGVLAPFLPASQPQLEFSPSATGYKPGSLVSTDGSLRAVSSVATSVVLNTGPGASTIAASPTVTASAGVPISGSSAPVSDQQPQGSIRSTQTGLLYQQQGAVQTSPNWQFVGAGTLDALADVNITGEALGQVLTYDITDSYLPSLVQAPAFGDSGGSGTSATATLISVPTNGNTVMCMVSYSNYAGATITTPSGWTKVYDNVSSSASPYNNAVFTKTVTSSADQTITVPYSRNDGITVALFEILGTAVPTGFSQINSSTTPLLIGSPQDLVFAMGCVNGGSSGGAATGWTEQYEGGVPFHMGDFQWYTGPATTSYQTAMTGFTSTVIFKVPASAVQKYKFDSIPTYYTQQFAANIF